MTTDVPSCTGHVTPEAGADPGPDLTAAAAVGLPGGTDTSRALLPEVCFTTK